MNKSIVFSIGALLLSACAEKVAEPDSAPKGRNISFTAAVESSRAHLDAGKTAWDADDVIGCFAGEGNVNVRFTTTAAAAGEFSGVINGTPESYYLYFPHSDAASLSGSVLASELPAVQQLKAGTYDSSVPMAVAAGSLSDGVTFLNLCGVLHFTLSSNIDRTLTSLEFKSADDTPAAGKYTVDMAYGTYPQLVMSDGGSATVTLSGAAAVARNVPAEFYVLLPPAEYKGGFTVTVTDRNGDSESYVFEKDLTIKRSVITSVGTALVFDSEDAPETDPDAPAWEAAAWVWTTDEGLISGVTSQTIDKNAVSLSAEGGYANCYIVPAAGTYTFPALKPDGTPVDSAYPKAQITFTASELKGNALLAYKDAEGRILWSWHIWCTDTPSDQIWGAYTWLDRNLGATGADAGSEAATYGLQYQWGRKDPFPGSNSWEGINLETTKWTSHTWPTILNGYAWEHVNDGTGLSIEESILQPTSMSRNTTNVTDGSGAIIARNLLTKPWVKDLDNDQMSALWSGSAKTNYDPCPAGYRVPSRTEVETDFVTPSETAFPSSAAGPQYRLSSDGSVLLPAAGYRNSDHKGSLSLIGEQGYYWTADTEVLANNGMNTIAARLYATKASGWSFESNRTIVFSTSCKFSYTASVRCVKIR